VARSRTGPRSKIVWRWRPRRGRRPRRRARPRLGVIRRRIGVRTGPKNRCLRRAEEIDASKRVFLEGDVFLDRTKPCFGSTAARRGTAVSSGRSRPHVLPIPDAERAVSPYGGTSARTCPGGVGERTRLLPWGTSVSFCRVTIIFGSAPIRLRTHPGVQTRSVRTREWFGRVSSLCGSSVPIERSRPTRLAHGFSRSRAPKRRGWASTREPRDAKR
jgi:hypothetical protein